MGLALKANHNAYIAGQMAKNQFGTLGQAGSENIFGGMTADLGRLHIAVNGQTFAKDADTDIQAIFTVFKEALPAEKAQKAVSSVMHQGSFGDLSATMPKTPIVGENGAEPVELFNLPGAKLLFQRDMNDDDGLYSRPAFDSNQSPNCDLQVSPDGNTAVVTMRMKSPLMMGLNANVDESFGTIQLTQKLTLDLRPDVPVVTDVQLSQIITD